VRAQRAPFPQPPPEDLSGAPPGPPVPRHLLGAAYVLREHALLRGCRRRYGPVFSLNAWPVGLMVVVADPGEVKRIFTGDPGVLHAGEGNAVALPVAGAESILMVDEERHLRRRKLMLPPFHGERLGVYETLIEEIADAEIDRWPLRTEFPIHPTMQAITLRVILRAVLGIEDAARRSELERLIPDLINSRILLWPFLQRDLGARSPWRRFGALSDRVDTLLFEEIEAKRRDPALAERDDILSMLLGARDEQGEPMGDGELRDQLVTLLLAGHETSATTLAWAFERLVRTPAALGRLRDSLAEGSEDYLDCVVKETLRARPIVGVALRRLTASLPVGGYTVPAGALLGASMILLHSDPDLYPEPGAFRPERFHGKRSDPYSWIPFGGGVRRCLGASFATFEMKIVLRRAVERCELHAPGSRPERPRRRFVTYAPDRGARVVLAGRRRAEAVGFGAGEKALSG
jgi:cytochrome P450